MGMPSSTVVEIVKTETPSEEVSDVGFFVPEDPRGLPTRVVIDAPPDPVVETPAN